MSGQTLPVPPGASSITIRRAKPEDAPVCGRVCFDAFYKISTSHGFPCDFPSSEVAVGIQSLLVTSLRIKFPAPGRHGASNSGLF